MKCDLGVIRDEFLDNERILYEYSRVRIWGAGVIRAPCIDLESELWGWRCCFLGALLRVWGVGLGAFAALLLLG